MLCIIISFKYFIFALIKKHNMKNLFLTLLFAFLIINNTYCQSKIAGKKYIFEFRDGTTIIGTFIKAESGNIYINDLEGEEVYIPKVMIAQTHEVTSDNLKDGEYWFPNLHDSRYFFSPSAFGLEKGEGYYSHSYWLLWQAQWGITDEFSIGGGTTPWGIPSSVNAKFSFNVTKSLHYAFGWFYVGNLFGLYGIESDALVNMPYLVLTSGNKNNNFTFGAGYNITPNLNPSQRTVVNVGGTFRTNRRFAFVFEGWVFNPADQNFTLLGGPGIRYFRKINRVTAKNGAGASTWDFQLLMNPEMEGVIPMFGASRKF